MCHVLPPLHLCIGELALVYASKKGPNISLATGNPAALQVMVQRASALALRTPSLLHARTRLWRRGRPNSGAGVVWGRVRVGEGV